MTERNHSGSRRALGLAVALVVLLSLSQTHSADALPPGALGWHDSPRMAVRGITIGPIESALHPNRGYGSEPFQRALHEARRMGARWVSLTPFGRIWDLSPSGVSLTFEEPFPANRAAVLRAIAQAHEQRLEVLLIPQLWVETGGWRGEIEFTDDAAWAAWAASYRTFILEWAKVAAAGRAEMFGVGVELRSWATTTRAPSLIRIIRDVRQIYPGLITYAANWDDVEDTVILGELDLIGINAFFPLADRPGAGLNVLQAGAKDASARIEQLARRWDKPVLFTEFGYTTRSDPAVRPWEWPEHLSRVVVDQAAQAEAYHALLSAFWDRPWFAGFFAWRTYADPDDLSQEAEWGFSPRGKLAELVLRDAFGAHLAADGPRPRGASIWRRSATSVGRY